MSPVSAAAYGVCLQHQQVRRRAACTLLSVTTPLHGVSLHKNVKGSFTSALRLSLQNVLNSYNREVTELMSGQVSCVTYHSHT